MGAADDIDAAQKALGGQPPKAAPAKPPTELINKIKQLERDLLKEKEKLEIAKREQKTKLIQVKQLAQEKAEEMVSKKLKACGEVYKTEFEFLAVTFEELKVEVDRLKKQENDFKTIISDQEAIIL